MDCSFFSGGTSLGSTVNGNGGGGPVTMPEAGSAEILLSALVSGIGNSNTPNQAIYFNFRRRGGNANDTSTGVLQWLGARLQWTRY